MKYLIRFNENIVSSGFWPLDDYLKKESDKYKILADVLTDIFDRHDIEFYERGNKSNNGYLIGNDKWEYWYKDKKYITGLSIFNITESKAYRIEFDLKKLKSKLSNFGISVKWSITEDDDHTYEDNDENFYYIGITIDDTDPMI
jgi:hypothetical protein